MTRGTLAGWTALFAIATVGCESGPPPPPPCVEAETMELSSFVMERWRSDGVRGVDLDGRDSDATDDLSCNEDDFVDPDGSSVDAQSATLVPTLEYFAGGVLPVVTGDVTLTMEPLDEGEECAGGSFSLNGGTPRSAEWNGSTLRAYDLGDLPLSFEYAGAVFDLVLRDVGARVTITAGRIDSVVLAGAIEADALVPLLSAPATVVAGEEAIRETLQAMGDLERDVEGACQSLSFVFEAQR